MNICVSSEFICQSPNSQCDCIWSKVTRLNEVTVWAPDPIGLVPGIPEETIRREPSWASTHSLLSPPSPAPLSLYLSLPCSHSLAHILSLLSPPTVWRIIEMTTDPKPSGKDSEWNLPCGYLDLGLPASRMIRNKFLLLKPLHLWCFVMATQADYYTDTLLKELLR